MTEYLNRSQPTRYLIIHCSDTYADMDTSAATIDQWHRARGFSGIGYHFVIRRDGYIENGRPVDAIGAHCKAKGRNRDSVGICLVGGKSREDGGPEDNFTREQIASLRNLISQLKLKYPDAAVAGHRDFDKSRACPCFDFETALQKEDQNEKDTPTCGINRRNYTCSRTS